MIDFDRRKELLFGDLIRQRQKDRDLLYLLVTGAVAGTPQGRIIDTFRLAAELDITRRPCQRILRGIPQVAVKKGRFVSQAPPLQPTEEGLALEAKLSEDLLGVQARDDYYECARRGHSPLNGSSRTG